MRLFPLLARYVLKELLKVFLVSLTALTVMLVLLGVVKQAAEQGLGPAQVVRIIPYILPDMLRYTIPASLLFAASTVYGRMSGSNEVVAIKSLGISPMVLLWPCLVLSFLLSLLTVWLNDAAITWGQAGVQRVVIEAVEEIVYGMLRTQRSYSNKYVSILVRGVDGRTLLSPTFTFIEPPMTITAREAEIRSDGEVLSIVCRHGTVEGQGQGRFKYVFPDEWEHELSLLEASRKTDDSHIPTRVPLSLIPTEVARVRRDLEMYERSQAVKMGLDLAAGDFEALAAKDWNHESMVLEGFWNHLHRLFTEPPRRWSAGFSCLCFALVGAPMAIWRKNSDFLTSFFLCFLPILFVYYPLLMFGVEQSKSGALPPYIVWLGNVVLASWGLWMLRVKVLRY